MFKKILLSAILFAQINNLSAYEYDKPARDRLIEKMRNRRPLSETEEKAKARMLQVLPDGERSSIIYKSPNVTIDYIFGKSDDLRVEITTIAIDLAKVEAVYWFLSQGFRHETICDFPVMFYLHWEIAKQLNNTNLIFNPQARGC